MRSSIVVAAVMLALSGCSASDGQAPVTQAATATRSHKSPFETVGFCEQSNALACAKKKSSGKTLTFGASSTAAKAAEEKREQDKLDIQP